MPRRLVHGQLKPACVAGIDTAQGFAYGRDFERLLREQPARWLSKG